MQGITEKNIKLNPTIQIFNPFIFDKNKLVFLDRDGVINDNSDYYIVNVSDIIILEGVKEFIMYLSLKGFSIFIITNQSCVGKGLVTLKQEKEINRRIVSLIDYNQVIKSVIFCPHVIEDGCDCKKPATGMVDFIIDEFNLSFKNIESSYFIGDSVSDIECASSRKMRSFLISENFTLSDCLKNIVEG
ncbi:TPA: D-glycero-alpha-D-manno-heptose-1,7-bisphosphate 7-phosphatase [Streptococcus suis]